MKVYVQNNSFKMVGKAKDIRTMLKQYREHFETVREFIEKNQQTYTVVTSSTNKIPKKTQYYLLFSRKR